MVTVERIEEAILKKMGRGDSTVLTMKNSGDELIICRGEDGYTMYNGCELVIGDVPLWNIAVIIAKGNVRPY